MEKYDIEVNGAGTVRYYKKGTIQLHRLDGPAVEHQNGSKFWYQNGELHRLDGPAVEFANGVNEWYINDEQYTEAQFNAEIARLARLERYRA